MFTSDHGEFSGDRGLGEKELFHDEIVRVPFIVCDPDPRADATRGGVDSGFAEGVDVVPTILDALGIPGAPHRIEGRSLLPLCAARRAAPGATRRTPSSTTACGARAGFSAAASANCRAFMIRTAQWKYVHWQGFRPQLFDVAADPGELCDVGDDPRYGAERARLAAQLFDWLAARKRRTTAFRRGRRRAHRHAPAARRPHRHLVIRRGAAPVV